MLSKRSGYGKSSWYAILAVDLRMEIDGVHEVYNFGIQHYERGMEQLHSRYDRLGEEAFIDERDRLDSIRHELGYAMVFLLCSLTDDGLQHVLRKLNRDDPGLEQEFRQSYSEDKLPDKNFLERYALFHKDKFGTDFWSSVSPPDGSSAIDFNLLVDFIWARNKIAHQRGAVRATQTRRPDGENRDVPLSSDGSQIEVQQPYVERVSAHLRAFFDRVIADLNARCQ